MESAEDPGDGLRVVPAGPEELAWWVVAQDPQGARLKSVRELEKLLVHDVVQAGQLLEAPSRILVWNAYWGEILAGSMVVELFDRRPLRHLELSGPYFQDAAGARRYAVGISAWVRPSLRGRGVGAALFAELERLERPVFISFVNDSLRRHFDDAHLAAAAVRA